MHDIDHSRPYILKLPDLLSAQECQALIDRIEVLGPSVAPITTARGFELRTEIRNNDRVMFDDHDLGKSLFDRAFAKLPKDINGMSVVGINERFRCYRYKPGMRFAPHSDGAFQRNDREWSCYTFMVYLNEGFEGGHTVFFTRPEVSIVPKMGMGLLFQHLIIHEGAVVTAGTKYVVRTDLMYRVPSGT